MRRFEWSGGLLQDDRGDGASECTLAARRVRRDQSDLASVGQIATRFLPDTCRRTRSLATPDPKPVELASVNGRNFASPIVGDLQAAIPYVAD